MAPLKAATVETPKGPSEKRQRFEGVSSSGSLDQQKKKADHADAHTHESGGPARPGHSRIGSLELLHLFAQSVQMAMVKETRDHKVLVKIRPQLFRMEEWNEAFSVLSELVLKEGGEVKTSAAPPNPLIRQLHTK